MERALFLKGLEEHVSHAQYGHLAYRHKWDDRLLERPGKSRKVVDYSERNYRQMVAVVKFNSYMKKLRDIRDDVMSEEE